MLQSRDLRTRLHAAAGGFPRAFWVLWAGTFVNRLGTFVVPFLAVYLTQARGLTAMKAGLVVSLWGVGGAIAAPVGGFLADHVGRRFTMLFSLVLGGASMIALGFARDITVIAPGVFLVSLVSEMYRPGMQAAVADLVPPEDRVRAFGLVYWVINLGFALGLVIGGTLATVSYLLLFVGDGLTSMLFGLLVWRGVPETRPARPAPAGAGAKPEAAGGFFAPYRDPPYVLFLVLSVMVLVIFLQHVTTMPIDMVAHGIPRPALGALLALNGIFIVVIQPFLTPVLARHNRSRVIAVGGALVGSGFGVYAFTHHALGYGAGVFVWTLGEMCVLPTANAVVADLAPTYLRGRYQGAYGLTWGLAAFIGPAAGTWVMQTWGSPVLWGGCLALGLLSAAGHLALAPALTRIRAERVAARAG